MDGGAWAAVTDARSHVPNGDNTKIRVVQKYHALEMEDSGTIRHQSSVISRIIDLYLIYTSRYIPLEAMDPVAIGAAAATH